MVFDVMAPRLIYSFNLFLIGQAMGTDHIYVFIFQVNDT